ncbi:hypothetical protein DZF91_03235 [Actinomadura logoneensis]|uniref:Uncharacterized protein n=1 Tax=Actinomadura logoneensis TaxID=2293572 RepID=A0A372JSQ1_9ACTN|nr:hypothetical protein [Actinomadura logoneensis]RFU43065.1 hypothetical protein DZF91_03235 [Actinomadura logoneensis]
MSSGRARAASLRLIAAFLERDGAAVEEILRGRDVAELADMLESLAGLATLTTQAMALAGAAGPVAEGATQRRVVDLVSEVAGPVDGATAHLLWTAFAAGEASEAMADVPAVAVQLMAACAAVTGEDWSGWPPAALARQYRALADRTA